MLQLKQKDFVFFCLQRFVLSALHVRWIHKINSQSQSKKKKSHRQRKGEGEKREREGNERRYQISFFDF